MKPIKPVLLEIQKPIVGNADVASSEAIMVTTYSELQELIAQLSILNKRYVLYFRGQKEDYTSDDNAKKRKSSFYPTIFRGTLSSGESDIRWHKLDYASKRLVEEVVKEGLAKDNINILKRKHLLQWSILQHYEVTGTPLIDVTQSLRVACSFAMLNESLKNNDAWSYLYVFGLPYVNHRISVDSEEYLTNIRLLSIAPAEAKRPYFQEGFLICEDVVQKEYVVKSELDLNNRLIAKFKIPRSINFWDCESIVPISTLYPIDDKIADVCQSIKTELDVVFNRDNHHALSKMISADDFITFFEYWQEIESILKMSMKIRGYNEFNIPLAVRKLELSADLSRRVLATNKTRNFLVHQKDRYNPSMAKYIKDVPILCANIKRALHWGVNV